MIAMLKFFPVYSHQANLFVYHPPSEQKQQQLIIAGFAPLTEHHTREFKAKEELKLLENMSTFCSNTMLTSCYITSISVKMSKLNSSLPAESRSFKRREKSRPFAASEENDSIMNFACASY